MNYYCVRVCVRVHIYKSQWCVRQERVFDIVAVCEGIINVCVAAGEQTRLRKRGCKYTRAILYKRSPSHKMSRRRIKRI